MKKYIILLFIVITGGLCSCNDMLDLQNDGRTTKDEIFTTRNGVRGYLNLCYSVGTQYQSADYASYCDDAHHSDDTFSGSAYNYRYNNANNAGTFNVADGRPWETLYRGIRYCNVYIEGMKNVTTSVVYATEEELEGWVAQAHALRAFYYLQLIKRYGAVPLLTESYTTTHDYSADRKASFSEVVTQILADTDFALASNTSYDGIPWDRTNHQWLIMTRATVYAVRSQAVLFAASPQFADGTYDWQDALEYTKEALYQTTQNGFELFTTKPSPNVAQNAYALYFLTHPDELRAVDKETIYGSGGINVWQSNGLPTTAGQTTAGACPTQELVDAYEMQETGLPAITGYSDDKHMNPIINEASGYDPANPYEGRDPRFYATVYYHGADRTLGDAEAPSRDEHVPAELDGEAGGNNNVKLTEEDGVYHIVSLGGDPYIYTKPLAADLNAFPPTVFIRFKYKAPERISNGQFFFATPGAVGGQSTAENLVFEKTGEEWKDFELDLSQWSSQSWWGWGKAGHRLRFDFVGGGEGKELYMKDFEFNIYAGPIAAEPVNLAAGEKDAINVTDRRNTHTGYYMRKYNRWNSNRDNNADGAVRMFRLAELYMNFAEAAYNAEGPDAKIELGSGVSMSAREAVNVVRARAEMPPLPTGLPKDEFEKRYRNERRVEFAYEEHRYFDVRRWKIMEETERYLSGMKVAADGSMTRFSIERKSWDPKYYLYPLDRSEVNKMQDYTGVSWQNPGWN